MWGSEGEAYSNPTDSMRVGRATCAATVMFVAKGVDDDRIVQCSCS